MATRADAVILVIRAGSTTKHALRQARDILLQVNARISGVLLNAVNLGSPDYYSYYGRMGKFGRSYYREDYKETDGPNDDASGNDEIISAITSGGA
jgi:Mrp family chromosome partitioning ATPase